MSCSSDGPSALFDLPSEAARDHHVFQLKANDLLTVYKSIYPAVSDTHLTYQFNPDSPPQSHFKFPVPRTPRPPNIQTTPPMSNQSTLEPSLYALLPSSSRPQFLARLSLRSLHVQPHLVRDDIYHTAHPLIAGQHRCIRLRSTRKPHTQTLSQRDEGAKYKGKEREDGAWYRELAYVWSELTGREYVGMSLMAIVALVVVGMSSREEIEGFIKALGYE